MSDSPSQDYTTNPDDQLNHNNKRSSFKNAEKYSTGWRYWSSLPIFTGDWVTLVLQSKRYQ